MPHDPLHSELVIVAAILRQARQQAQQIVDRHDLASRPPHRRSMQQLVARLEEALAAARRFEEVVHQEQHPR